ncbi:hypothetical protein M426DRAFT_268856 [Hypoxylon sp. CI-4A]|nr:hypothetical protein M426DRAFT_268856 [Hypoxylon sp. CI-4A]
MACQVRKEQYILPSRSHPIEDSTQGSSLNTEETQDVELSIHPLPTQHGTIIRIQPPIKPSNSQLDHVPCDIVLVIDVSGSMQMPAPGKMSGDDGGVSEEHFGLSILDMVKHAARTILSTLNEGDRLGIVTFSREAVVIQKLLSMTPKNKKLAESNIEKMRPDSMTNLWHGIQQGINLFEGEENTGRVPAVMILTDGQPNYMAPGQGYIPKMRSTWESLPASLFTFGFGYDIRSGLLKSIAELGGGNYAFIPDAGMIGTVFVHAVAHLQTTYATKCRLEVVIPKRIHYEPTASKSIDQRYDEEWDCRKVTINLGNLQYGQSRDIYLEINRESLEPAEDNSTLVEANLTYSQMRAAEFYVPASKDLRKTSTVLSEPEIAYHQSRWMLCNFLSSFFPLRKDEEYETRTEINPKRCQPALGLLLNAIPARQYDDEFNKSLMEDLSGQISLALSSEDYFSKWGFHYFLSLCNAHSSQLCNSFKDPGPLMYNRNAFFIKCRDALDKAFDTIPPPTPSCPSMATTGHINMARLNSSITPCFAGSCKVLLADGQKVPVWTLHRGSFVRTPLGSRRVVSVLKTMVRGASLCGIAGLLVTPWHPIRIEGMQGGWSFPVDYLLESEEPRAEEYTGAIYSILLERDESPEAHAIEVGGVWAVTLGHGILRGKDSRSHPFLGDYGRVAVAIAMLHPDEDGVALSGGVRRDGDGLVCGFAEYGLPEVMEQRLA